MAQFVVHLGFTPAAYWAMTGHERSAILAEVARAKSKT